MPAVVNLGQFGPQRPSVLGPAAKIAETAGPVAAKDRATAASLKVALAEQERKQNKLDMENTYTALENLSSYMNSKSEQEREAFKQTDFYKQTASLVKKHLPSYYDSDRGEVLTLANKDMYETRLTALRTGIADKISKGEQLSDKDVKLKDFLDKTDVDIAAEAIDLASKSQGIGAPGDPDYLPAWDIAGATDQSKIVRYYMGLLQKSRKSMYTGELAEGAIARPNDPLNLR